MNSRSTINLSPEQLRFIELLVARNSGVSSIEIEDPNPSGPGDLQVRLFDKTGTEIGQQTVRGFDNELPY